MTLLRWQSLLIVGLVSGCLPPPRGSAAVPALEYANGLRTVPPAEQPVPVVSRSSAIAEPRARLRFAGGEEEIPDDSIQPLAAAQSPNLSPQELPIDSAQKQVPPSPIGSGGRDYNGPLSLGDPGVSASLWREGGAGTNLYHDFRAFQAMDLVTILVTEVTEGSKAADTRLESSSSFIAAIEKFFGLEVDAKQGNPNLDPTALINATAASEFEGRAETTRRGRLRGTISAMVVEVLPSGILRVAGEKIISVNGEEQIMVLSGLIRTRDVNSKNEVDSAKIANMRIDYFGKGSVGDQQSPGWLSVILRKVWPF